jgi:predicted dehydrogenase
MARLRLAVVGVGHLGREHARILARLPDVELVGVVDTNPEQAESVAQCTGCTAFGSFRPLLKHVEAAVIAVPTSYHHAVASEFLRRGVPVLIEKPLAANLAQAEELVTLAQQHNVLLQVGHIERFNPALEDLLQRGLRPKFVQCERLGTFTGRSTDTGVVLDLMIHDLDVLLTLVQAPVCAVEALGLSIFGEPEDVAHARLRFANGCVAHVSASRASRESHRRMQVWGPEGYASLDFGRRHLTLVQPSEELRRHGLTSPQRASITPLRLKEELFSHYLQTLERECTAEADQLTRELRDFIHCVRTGAQPRVSGEDGRAAIALATRILEAARQHYWEGDPAGPAGPTHLPRPHGPLFQPSVGDMAA